MAENKLKVKKEKSTTASVDKLIDLCAELVDEADVLCDRMMEMVPLLIEYVFIVAATIVTTVDIILDVVSWTIQTTAVLVGRQIHDLRMGAQVYRKEVLKISIMLLTLAVGVMTMISAMTHYEYAYNGKTLGLVEDQQDVLEILELASEELTHEYGSSIVIDPDSDISFKRIFTKKGQIDDMDTVLRKFTYMGDIQTDACAIYADGKIIAIVESEPVAKDILNQVLENYTRNDDDVEYEYIGFAEEIKIEPYSTALSNVSSKSSAYKKIRSGGQQAVTYTVESGDTLYEICTKLDVSLSQLKSMNPDFDFDAAIHAGDKLLVTEEVPLLTVETIEVSTYAETIEHETEYKDSSKYYEGDHVISVSGEDGKARITARLVKHNGTTVEKEVLKEEVIIEPVTEVILKGTKERPPTVGTGNFIRPVNVSVYSGYGWRWGRMHYGIDLSTSTGTPIYAADGGTVVKAGWSGAYGYLVKINHGNGFTTIYAHCSALYVSAGDKVYQGQRIAAVGNTGRSTGPHCHFEILYNGVNVNPSLYV